MTVRVTLIKVEPASFQVGGDGCTDGGPSCAGFTFTHDVVANDQDECDVPLRRTEKHLDADSELILDGAASCPAGQPDFCRRLPKARPSTIRVVAHSLAPPAPPAPVSPTDSAGSDGEAPPPAQSGSQGPDGWRR